MSDSCEPPRAGSDLGPDTFKTIDTYKRDRIHFGCFGLSGWTLLPALAGLALLIYLVRHPLSQ
jgi:hypothetical protein